MGETAKALARLRRNWQLFWIGWHVTGLIEHLEKLGDEGVPAKQAVIDAYLRKVPR